MGDNHRQIWKDIVCIVLGLGHSSATTTELYKTLEKVSQPRPTKIFDRSFLKFRTLMVALLNVGVAWRLQEYPH